jgi:hypothetical protein
MSFLPLEPSRAEAAFRVFRGPFDDRLCLHTQAAAWPFFSANSTATIHRQQSLHSGLQAFSQRSLMKATLQTSCRVSRVSLVTTKVTQVETFWCRDLQPLCPSVLSHALITRRSIAWPLNPKNTNTSPAHGPRTQRQCILIFSRRQTARRRMVRNGYLLRSDLRPHGPRTLHLSESPSVLSLINEVC